MDRFIARYVMVALSVVGSAILLFSCEREEEPESESQIEMMMTEYSENLSVVMSQNGRRSYHFKTPLLEGYSLAREPYREFPKGVEMTTYKNDSLSSVDAVLTANYAIHYETRDLWEARGNVVVEKSDGKKIYSNVDSKIVQNDGRDVFIGEGFESDEEFKDWRFRRMKGRMEVEVKPNESDSTAVAEPADRTSESSRPATDHLATDHPATDRPAAPVAARPAAPLSEEPPLAAPAVRPAGQDELRPAEPVGEIQPLRRAVHADEAGE